MSTNRCARVDSVMESKALSGPSSNEREISHILCGMCAKMADRQCSVCKVVRYCNEECQRLHWQKHKSRCKPPMPKILKQQYFVKNWNPFDTQYYDKSIDLSHEDMKKVIGTLIYPEHDTTQKPIGRVINVELVNKETGEYTVTNEMW